MIKAVPNGRMVFCMREVPKLAELFTGRLQKIYRDCVHAERQAEKARRLAVLALLWAHLERRAARERQRTIVSMLKAHFEGRFLNGSFPVKSVVKCTRTKVATAGRGPNRRGGRRD
jgi:hypothetical protein